MEIELNATICTNLATIRLKFGFLSVTWTRVECRICKPLMLLYWESAELIKFPTLMGSVGGWVFVLDVTRG